MARKPMHERAEDVALIHKVDADNRAAARSKALEPLVEYRKLRDEGGNPFAAARFYSQHETEIAAARALEREVPATPPTRAQREARIIANVQQRNADANAINTFKAYKELSASNPVQAASMLQRHYGEISRGRALATETPNDSDPPPKNAA